MSVCLTCKQPIDGEPVVNKYKGTPVLLHPSCWREIQDRHAANIDFAKARVEGLLSSLPAFSVPISSPDFALRVKSERLRNFAKRYQPDSHGSVVLLGGTGAGKSTAAAAAVLRLSSEAVDDFTKSGAHSTELLGFASRIVWVTAAALCVARKQHRLGEGEAPVIKRAESATLLVLDEVGQELAEPAWLLELIDTRYARGLPVISTSGLKRAEIEARYGSGSTRRLIEPRGHFIDLFESSKGPA